MRNWPEYEAGRRARGKFHLGVDEEGRIVASILVGGEADYSATEIELIEDTGSYRSLYRRWRLRSQACP